MMDRSLNGKKKKDPAEGELAEPVRVTDRRRINLEQNQNQESNNIAEGPSLKPTYVEELEARTKAAEKLVDEVQGRFNQLRQQLQKETDETRQRLNRAADERAQRDKADFIASLLPVGDNLARAIQAAESASSTETIAAGIRSTASAFESALAGAGVEAIESVGQDFDPQLHEAVDTVEVEHGRAGKVITEYRRGFKMGDRLLRPAQVQVGRALGEISEAYDSQSSKG